MRSLLSARVDVATVEGQRERWPARGETTEPQHTTRADNSARISHDHIAKQPLLSNQSGARAKSSTARPHHENNKQWQVPDSDVTHASHGHDDVNTGCSSKQVLTQQQQQCDSLDVKAETGDDDEKPDSTADKLEAAQKSAFAPYKATNTSP